VNRWLRAPVLLAAAALLQCSAGRATAPTAPDAPGGPPPSGGSAILFIGNSLTQSNDLPLRVQDVARDAGAAIDVSAVVSGGFSLEDHLGSGPAVPRIRSRSWSVVVMQQGPSTLPESRALLVRDATRMAAEIRAVGARPALLMVWGLPGQRQQDVDASYRAAAQATESILIPAGNAWQLALARDRSLRMTVADGFHPSPLGTWLAALTVHCTLNGSLPAPPPLAVERQRAAFDLTEAQSRIVHESACAAR
jgi:hypothetical protein